MSRAIVRVVSLGLFLFGSAPGAGHAKVLRQARLVHVGGENPSVSPALPAEGLAQWNGSSVRVTLRNMDPARFGAACRAEVRAGVIAATGVRLAAGMHAETPVVHLAYEEAGPVGAGNQVDVRVYCERDGAPREVLRWVGSFA